MKFVHLLKANHKSTIEITVNDVHSNDKKLVVFSERRKLRMTTTSAKHVINVKHTHFNITVT